LEQRYSIAGEVLQLPRSNATAQLEKVYGWVGKIPQACYLAVGKAVTHHRGAAPRQHVAAPMRPKHARNARTGLETGGFIERRHSTKRRKQRAFIEENGLKSSYFVK